MATRAFVEKTENDTNTMQKEIAKISGGDLYNLLLNRLVENEDLRKRRPRYITIDGNEILCETKEDAVALADFLEEVCGFDVHIGFYDPKYDEENEETDICTGKWCIYAE